MPSQEPEPEFVPGDAWQILSHLIAGVLLFGVLGWLADRWLGTSFLVAVGIVVGATLALYLIWCRLQAQNVATPRHPAPRKSTKER